MEQVPRKLTLTVSQESIHRATELAAALGYSNFRRCLNTSLKWNPAREGREERRRNTPQSDLPAGGALPINVIARAVGLHRSRILSLIESGELEGAIDIRTPGSCRSTIRVPRQAVIEFLEGRKVVATSGGQAREKGDPPDKLSAAGRRVQGAFCDPERACCRYVASLNSPACSCVSIMLPASS